MKIILVGDIHGRFTGLSDIVRNAANNHGCEVAIQVGDFGFHKGMFKALPVFHIPTYAIDGNHEDHSWLFTNKKVWKQWSQNNNFHYMPRQTIQDFGNSTLAFFGGALNVDRPQFGSIDKRTTNYPTFNETKEFVRKLNKLDKPIDLMVTHSAPCKIGVGMKGHPFFQPFIQTQIHDKMGLDTGPIHDCGEPALKVLWEGLNHKPKEWVFGHFHQRTYKKVQETNFWCVGCGDDSDGMSYTLPFIYDTETKEMKLEEGFV